MALHRDIHWIGRQWAVTGHGMQLIDQKLQGFFDIEVARLWDHGLIESMQAKEWLNAADFDKGLAVARTRYPQSTLPVTALPEAVPAQPIVPLPPVAKPEAPKRDEPPKPDKPALVPPAHAAPSRPEPVLPAAAFATPDRVEPLQEKPADFRMRFDGSAKFIRPWRVWMKRQT
jgi:hypothetical protein